MSQRTAYCWAALLAALGCREAPAAPDPVAQPDGKQARVYVTPEERREAGLGHQVTRWLNVAGLLELEQIGLRYDLADRSGHANENDFGKSAQLGATVTPVSWLKGDLVFQYDDAGSDSYRFDEAVIAAEAGDFELAAGMQYVPFGSYLSHFATGPVLEFGETRDTGLTLSWGPDDRLDLSAFAYRGRARHQGSDRPEWDWGAAFESSPSRHVLFGAGWLSDLADSQEGLLRDFHDRYRRRVAAWNAYAVVGTDRFDISAEVLSALGSFKELDADRNHPCAWNVELAYFPGSSIEWALRLEGSREVENAPRRRAGISLSWRATRSISLTLDYLRGWYKAGLAEDANGDAVSDSHQLGAQLSILF